MGPVSLLEIEKREMIRVIHEEHDFSDRFVAHMLKRNVRVEEDLVDQLFNSERETPGSSTSVDRPLWKRRKAGENRGTRFSRHFGGNGRDHSKPRQLFHEQVSETRLHQIQRRPTGKRFSTSRHSSRLSPPSHPFLIWSHGPGVSSR